MGNVTIRVHNPAMTAKRLESVFYNKALPKVADQMISDCNTFVRKQDGTLAASARVENNGRKITWNTKYAKKVYYTGTPRRNVNPQASLMWCEVAKRNYANDWAAQASSIIKGG